MIDRDVITGTVILMDILGPAGLYVPVVGFWGEGSEGEIAREVQPRLGGRSAESVEMFVEVLALQRREGEGNVRQNRALCGIKAVSTEMISSNLDVRCIWRRECGIFEDLGMDMS